MLCAAIAAAGLVAAAPAAAQVTVSESDAVRAGELAVPVNKSQVLRSDRPFAKALIGNPDIADVLPLSDRSIYVLGKKMGTTMALGLMAAGLGVGLVRAFEPGPGLPGLLARPTSGAGIEWQEYSASKLAELRSRGTPVFLDFTAAWCLTCQVNERVSLAHASVVERFRREGIVGLRADWTRRDDHITEALVSYGRQGVPVYVLFGRDSSAPPRVLPELLTPGILLTAIDESLGASATADASSP